MSNIHATADASVHQVSSALTTVVDVTATLQATVRTVAMRIVAAIEQRFMQRRLTRLSNHMLRDLGFERDWDGTIRPLREAD